MLASMGRLLRDGSGALLVLVSLGVMYVSIVQLRAHDYLAALLLVVMGLSLLRAGVELLRPSIGE